MLETSREVIRCLVMYPDWYQPPTSSIMKVGAARLDKNIGDGLNPGIVNTIDERTELCRRMTVLSERERLVLFLWYVKQMHCDDVADELGVSRRQAFRLKSKAIRAVVDYGMDERAA
ncbi:MAG: sigma factor-like helix-turn-helix DNA-binding protein [Actinomycetota bacterium]